MGNALTDEKNPVVGVSWDNAQQYIDWLNTDSNKKYRLPSEAEWEYASRGGKNTAYSWGKSIGKNNANCNSGCADQFEYTAAVGSFKANPYGLYDMHGNVWEWTQDCYHNTYKGAPSNNSAWESGGCDNRVLRGGSWSGIPGGLRSASRSGSNPSNRFNNIGFRVARTP